jgi:hypothetical protein
MFTKRDLDQLKSSDLGGLTFLQVCDLHACLLATIRQTHDRSLRPAAKVQLRRVGLSIRFRKKHRNAQAAPKERQVNYPETMETFRFSADERQKLSR